MKRVSTETSSANSVFDLYFSYSSNPKPLFLAIQSVEKKNNTSLSKKYRLPKRRYFGDLPPPSQRVRDVASEVRSMFLLKF